MSSQIKVLLSNQVERLYQQLKERLFSGDTTPFTKRVVIVPSPAMKGWLMQQLADDLGIAAGVMVTYLEPAIKWLQETLVEDLGTISRLPSRIELALLLEREITAVIGDCDNAMWRPLIKHIKGEFDLPQSRREQRRIVALSDQLASLFQQYEKYGKEMLKEWQCESLGGWQEALWRRVVNQVGPDQFEWKDGNVTVHLFAMSYLSQQQHRMMMELSEKLPVFYYLLSPCQTYWSDLLTDRESVKLYERWNQLGLSKSEQINAEEILFDRNPLLANWGKLGRLMASQIEDTLYNTKEDYIVNQDESLLHSVQNDLLLLRNPKNQPIRNFENDPSIQVHVASSKMREVEAIYNCLLTIIDRHNKEKEPICPKDIVVMAPDIMEYEPFIQSVFQDNKESLLDCQIMDLRLLSHNDLIQGFMHLIHLPQTRWDAQSILKLFEFSCFQDKYAFSPLDVKKLSDWIRKSNIRWGMDAEHRSELLLRQRCQSPMSDPSEVGTFKHGMERLLLGMAMIAPQEEGAKSAFSLLPLKEISSTDQELLGKWIYLMHAIKEDLQPLSDGSKRSLVEWANTLCTLLNRYFSWDAMPEDQKEQVEELFSIIEALTSIESLREDLFEFTSIRFHLEAALEQKRVCYRENHLQAVRFCSMLPMRALPAKVVVLMGMDEEGFPRRESRFSLNQLYQHPKADPFPTTTDFDRYLFLEAFLSARRYFVLSYSHQRSEEVSSLLVSELFSYMDRGYTVCGKLPSKQCWIKHPFFPFDRNYFSPETTNPAYSLFQYRAACSYYTQLKKKKHAFVPKFSIDYDSQPKIEEVDIKYLTLLARNPVAFYFNRKLGIYLEREEKRLIKTDEEFLLSVLDQAMIKKNAIKNPLDLLLNHAEVEGKLPVGPFKSYSIDKIRKEFSELLQNMQSLGINSDRLYTLECTEHCETPTELKNKWQLPPLNVTVNGRQIKIIGNLLEVCSEGYIGYLKDEKKEITKIWPHYLIWCQLIQMHSLPFKDQLLLVKGGKLKSVCFEDPLPHLEDYLEYYLAALENPSPLLPEWIPDLVESNPERFQKKIKQTLSERNDYFYNDYMLWMVKGSDFPSSEVMMVEWKGVAEKLFGNVFQKWFSKVRV